LEFAVFYQSIARTKGLEDESDDVAAMLRRMRAQKMRRTVGDSAKDETCL
jgi:hypothetical protein